MIFFRVPVSKVCSFPNTPGISKSRAEEMHASYLKRYTDWQRRKQELEMDLDLSKMSFFDSDKVIEIERVPVKVEVSGIRDLYLRLTDV